MGSDHRAPYLRIKRVGKPLQKWRNKDFKKQSSPVGWRPLGVFDYQRALDERLADVMHEQPFLDVCASLENRLHELEKIVVDTAIKCKAADKEMKALACGRNDHINELLLQRRLAKFGSLERSDLSKHIQKELRKLTRKHHSEQIDKILKDFKGLRDIASIRNNGRRKKLISVIDNNGKIKTDRRDIVDVFADFYADLYACKSQYQDIPAQDNTMNTAARFTVKEVKTQLGFMAKGKAGDNAGLVAEMLQSSSDAFMEAMANMFSDILSTATTPAAWKHSRVRVLFKKGDAKMPENYRPITLLPILYKLFSRLILSRVRETLEGAQASDQAERDILVMIIY